MKCVVLVLAIAFALAPVASAAAATNEGTSLQLSPKAAIMAAAPHKDAPFVSPVAAMPEPELRARPEHRQDPSHSSCELDHALCYDARSGHIVYKPARNWMPDLPGLTPDNISVKRDRIIFRYTF